MPNSHRHDKTVHTTLAWVVTITAALFFFYEFIQMNLFNTINIQLRAAFQLNAEQLGQLFSMYFYANFLCLFLAGNLIDRFSTKKILLFTVSGCTIGTFIFSVATTYWMAASGRFLVGGCASFCFLSCIRIASRWFPPYRMALVTGVVVTMAMIGGLVAQTPFALLTEFLGSWRHALLVNTGLGVAIVIATIFLVHDYPPDGHVAAKAGSDHLKELGLWRCIRLAAFNPQNWFGGLYTALMNLPVFVIGGLWGILYLTGVHHLTPKEASYATTIFFVGVIFGCLIFGWVSDYIERRVLPMIIGSVLSLIVMCTLMFVPGLAFWSIMTLFFLIGLVTSSQVLTYPTIAELNPICITSTAISIDSLCIMLSGFVVPPFFGWLMEKNSMHQIVNGVTVYTAQDFNHAMLIMPIAFVVALVIALFIRETYCRSQA